MLTRELQRLWWDWLGTSERLTRSLYEQTAALTLRDVARVERIQPELDALLQRMKAADDEAATEANRLAGDLGSEPNLRSLVSALEKEEGQQVQALANRITVVARNVQTLMDKNRRLLENELEFVHGTMGIVAQAAANAGGTACCAIVNKVA